MAKQRDSKPAKKQKVFGEEVPIYKKKVPMILGTLALAALLYVGYVWFSTPEGEPSEPAAGVETDTAAATEVANVPGFMVPPPLITPTPQIPEKYLSGQFRGEWETCYEQMVGRDGATQQFLVDTHPTLGLIVKELENGWALREAIDSVVSDNTQEAAQDLISLLSSNYCREGGEDIFHMVPGRLGWLARRAEWIEDLDQKAAEVAKAKAAAEKKKKESGN